MANGKDHQYLLPAGLKDGLPPDAAFEAAIGGAADGLLRRLGL